MSKETISETTETPASAMKASLHAQIASLNEDSGPDVMSHPALEPTIGDVPRSSFWSNNKDDSESETLETPELDSDVPVQAGQSASQTIKFQVDGEERELSLSEAQKALSKKGGEARAFTQLAQAKKKLEAMEADLAAAKHKASLVDALEEVKHDYRAMIQIATGQDPDTWIESAIRKHNIMNGGSAVEKEQLERAERLAEVERKLRIREEQEEARSKRERELTETSTRQNHDSMVKAEYFRNQFKTGDEIQDNSLNTMVWLKGGHLVKELVAKYKSHPRFEELVPKIYKKAFDEARASVQLINTGSVQAEVDKIITGKKKKAVEASAITPSRKINQSISNDFSGLSIPEIADRLLGKKRFSR